jgi:hypothetical protein
MPPISSGGDQPTAAEPHARRHRNGISLEIEAPWMSVEGAEIDRTPLMACRAGEAEPRKAPDGVRKHRDKLIAGANH